MSIQNRYSLTSRDSEEVLEACESDALGFIPWFPLEPDRSPRRTALEEIAKSHGATSGQVALAWLLQHSPVMVPIPGTSSIEHLEENVAAAQLRLSEDELAQVETAAAGMTVTEFRLDPQTTIGHVHLKVSDLERAERFYVDLLGFHVTARYGTDAVFLSAGDNHHDLGLNTWQSKGGSPPPADRTGLFHFAILVPTRRRLAELFVRLRDAGVRISGASDHLVSEALYLHDPDGNGIEIYRDRDPSEWPRANGEIKIATLPLDLESLLAEFES